MIYTRSLLQNKKNVTIQNITVDDIYIKDIAYALSNIARFCGQLPFYSVALHSLEVSKLVPRELKLSALLHDASEAYLGDIITPVKCFLPDYVKLENKIMKLIAEKFNIEIDNPLIKVADKLCLERETEYLSERVGAFRFEEQYTTYEAFLGAFYDYQ
jgi:5'-deoxynucleotidase YfbR-like HD superfamily hydrolase